MNWQMNTGGDWELIQGGKRYRIEYMPAWCELWIKPLYSSPKGVFIARFPAIQDAQRYVKSMHIDKTFTD
jgi:hypothetical protein